jgi:hypothetical protein
VTELHLSFLDLHIQQMLGGYRYSLHFQVEGANRMYSEYGTAATPMQCTEMAMGYVARVVQEVLVAG